MHAVSLQTSVLMFARLCWAFMLNIFFCSTSSSSTHNLDHHCQSQIPPPLSSAVLLPVVQSLALVWASTDEFACSIFYLYLVFSIMPEKSLTFTEATF